MAKAKAKSKSKSKRNGQTNFPGTGRKKLPDLVAAAEVLKDAQSALADAKAEVTEATVDLMVLCRKYVASGDLTIDKEKHAESKVPVYIYQVEGEDGDLITRKINHGFVEGCSVTRAKRDEAADADAA